MRRLKKKIFIGLFAGAVLTLSLVKHTALTPDSTQGNQTAQCCDSTNTSPIVASQQSPRENHASMNGTRGIGSIHKLQDVYSYDYFDDVQDVQIAAARKWGVKPVRNRKNAGKRKDELVFVGSNPFYKIDAAMNNSIPYLVPRAAIMLEDIARSFLDSLYLREIPLHKIIVSSVLRTEEDVARLRKINPNASEQSCHRFGTTIDIAYNRYQTVCPPGKQRRAVQNDTLKWVLTQVMRDMKETGRCYVKYEKKQGCFHLTVR